MKQKTCVNLAAVALGLHILLLLSVLVVTALQTQIKMLFGLHEEALAIKIIPWTTIISIVVSFIPAIIILIVLHRNPSRKGTIILTVIIASMLIVNGILSPLFSSFLQYVTIKGAETQNGYYIASNAIMTKVISVIGSIFSPAAGIAQLLALGGACGHDFQNKPNVQI